MNREMGRGGSYPRVLGHQDLKRSLCILVTMAQMAAQRQGLALQFIARIT